MNKMSGLEKVNEFCKATQLLLGSQSRVSSADAPHAHN